MKKLEREDLYKLIYMAARHTCMHDGMYGITNIGKKNEGIEFKDNLSFKNLSKKERDTYIELVKEQVFEDKKSITTGSRTTMHFRAELPKDRIREYANDNFYDELMNYYKDEEYLEDSLEDYEDLLPFIQEELEKEHDEFYEKYQAMEEKEYDFEKEFEEEEEEINEQEELKKKIEIIKGMSKEDFQRLVYMTALEVSNTKTTFNKNKKSLLEKEEDEKQTYISCAQKSALKSFSYNPDLVFSTFMGMSEDTPEELKKIIIKQLLFDSTYNEIFEGYRLAKDKEKFFENCDKNFGVDISKKAIEEINTEIAQQFFEKIEEGKENFNHDDRIKEAVNNYLIGIIKKRYPKLSKENEAIFVEKISDTVNYEIENRYGYGGFGPRGLHCDNSPSPELEYAFCSMDFGEDWPDYRMHAAADLTFPCKMSISIEKGKYALASDGFNSEYLYMSEAYKKQALESTNQRIERELSKIPDTKKDEFEKEYIAELEKYNSERKPLIERKEIEDELSQKEEQFMIEAKSLMESYGQRIDEIDAMDLSKEEKERRKESILEETKKAEETYYQYKETKKQELSKIREKYGYMTLEIYDKEKQNIQNKEMWMRKRVIQYAEEENHKAYEEFNKTPHEAFTWPNTDHLPSPDLSRYFAEKDRLESYQTTTITKKENLEEKQALTKEQEELSNAFARAYSDYVKDSYNYRSIEYSKEKENIQELYKGLQEYFAQNCDNIQQQEFIKKFEKEDLNQMIETCGFLKERNLLYSGLDGYQTDIRFEDGILVRNVFSSPKIYYGKEEQIKDRISKLDSKIRFYQDKGIDSISKMVVYKLEGEKESFEQYLQEIKGEEKTLLELEEEKQKLEKVEQEAKELRRQFEEQDKNIENSDGEISQ